MKASYQSTIDSQSETTDRKFGENITSSVLLKRLSRKKRPTKIFKNDHKIQIQEPNQNIKFSPEVRSYAQDIINYVSNQESNSIITENYMEWQTDINPIMREILVGWLIEVSSGLNLKLQTLHLAVLLVDKFCYARNVLKRKYQVLGGAALFIAAKYEQISTPKLKKYVQIADGAYSQNELLIMESQILLTLNFDIKERSTLTFFEIKSQQYQIPKNIQNLGYFLLEMCLVEYDFCRKKPTYLSLAIIYTSMKIKKKKISKVKIFASQNGLDEDIFIAYLEMMYHLQSIKNHPKFAAIVKRYAVLLDQNFNSK